MGTMSEMGSGLGWAWDGVDLQGSRDAVRVVIVVLLSSMHELELLHQSARGVVVESDIAIVLRGEHQSLPGVKLVVGEGVWSDLEGLG